MPYGVLADIFCIILGGIIGPNLNIKITYKYREPLIKIFGISALAIGIISFIKVNFILNLQTIYFFWQTLKSTKK